ncbi:MAG: helix-turn-helix domain-containing protein [Clostridiales bacterium]|nr:helix-turn-helix domain-containing protein [Clostridiales bacterium]
MLIEIKIKTQNGDVYIYNNQAQAIKEARQKAGLTQVQVAEKLGVNAKNYNKYESGERAPKDATLEKIAEALNIDVNVLLCTGDKI